MNPKNPSESEPERLSEIVKSEKPKKITGEKITSVPVKLATDIEYHCENVLEAGEFRKAFPQDLFDELHEKFGVKWSDMYWIPDRLVADDFEAFRKPGSKALIDIEEVIRKHHDVEIVSNEEYDEKFITLVANGFRFEIENKKMSNFEMNRTDGISDFNLSKIKNLLPKNARVLYVGTSGDRILNKFFDNVVNLDITSDLLSPGDVKADAHELPFKDESFDLVFFKCMVSDVLFSQKVIGEVKRILKKGGYVFVTTSYPDSLKGMVDDPNKTGLAMERKARTEYKKQDFKPVPKKGFKMQKEVMLLRK